MSRRVGPPPVHAAEMILAAARRPYNPNAYNVVVSTSVAERISAETASTSRARGGYDPMDVDTGAGVRFSF